MPPLQIVLFLLPLLPQLILDVEALFSKQPKSGAQKKQAVLDAVGTGVQVAAGLGVKELADPNVQGQVVATAGALTDAVVGGLNAVGVLKHA